MLGLRRHTVEIARHHPGWSARFTRECKRLWFLSGGFALDIQHVGSTSVPGLEAKPILDIAMAVRSRADIRALAGRLVRAGYIDRGDGGRDGGYLLVWESATNVRTIHLHIVEQDDEQWTNYLGFRNALRCDAEFRRRYTALKRKLADEFRNDRRSYTNGKAAFIRKILRG